MTLPEEWHDLIWNVPPTRTSGACRTCHGVAPPTYDTCYKCGQIWSAQPGFNQIKLIVPCSVAVGGSSWYRAVQTYKAASFDQYAKILSAVLSEWLSAHGKRVAETLGRKPDLVTVVPSKKVPHPAPLWEVVHGIPGLRPLLLPMMRFRGGESLPHGRDSVITDQFEVTENVDSKAIVLIEDTWVSGQTPISAALALTEAGAHSIALISIARMVYEDTYTAEYQDAARPPYAPRWPK